MHIAYVAAFIPYYADRGILMHNWAILKALVQAGHRVTLCAIRPDRGAATAKAENDRAQAVASLGVDVHIIRFTPRVPPPASKAEKLWEMIRQAFHPTMVDFHPRFDAVPELAKTLDRIKPDAVVAYRLEALSAIHGLKSGPTIALLVDIPHLQTKFQWQLVSPIWRVPLSPLAALARRHQARFMFKLLADCNGVINFSALNTKWLCQHGVDCRYLPVPLFDGVGADWERQRQASPPRSKPKIVIAGHLRAIAMVEGLRLFVNETLPILEEALGPDGFEVHIFGQYDPPSDLVRKLARPSIRMRGYHPNGIGQELLASDILLVPTPMELAMHTRIIEGFAYGCCVVAHAIAAKDIPQMVHRENVLLGSDGRSLADALLEAIHKPALRRQLSQKGRQTYERYFSLETAGALLATELERLVRDGSEFAVLDR